MAWATMCRPNRVAARSLARPAQAGLVAARRAPSALLDTGRRSACGRCLDSQAWHWASACGWASTASIPSSEALWRSRLCRTSRLTSPITWVGVCRNRSSERVTTPSTEFSTPTTPYWALPAAVAWNTSSKLAQYIRSAAPPKNSMAACSQKVPAGPSTATRCGDSRARQADMISRQMAATCSSLSGPGLAVLIFSITWATRSGRKKGVPSRFLTSPTCSATWARWLSRLSSCWSSESIWTRRSPRVGKGALEGWVMGRLWAVALGWRRSGLCFFEFAQVVHQRLHAGQRHGVVDAGPHATDRLVALELQQPARLGTGQEGVVQRLVAQPERHVHARAAFGGHRVGVELRLVDEPVQQIGLGLVARLHGGHAAQAGFGLALEPLEGQARCRCRRWAACCTSTGCRPPACSRTRWGRPCAHGPAGLRAPPPGSGRRGRCSSARRQRPCPRGSSRPGARPRATRNRSPGGHRSPGPSGRAALETPRHGWSRCCTGAHSGVPC